jgi:hypothetical protein
MKRCWMFELPRAKAFTIYFAVRAIGASLGSTISKAPISLVTITPTYSNFACVFRTGLYEVTKSASDFPNDHQ